MLTTNLVKYSAMAILKISEFSSFPSDTSLVTLLDSESFRVAIALIVVADVCIPHSCRCSTRMDNFNNNNLYFIKN